MNDVAFGVVIYRQAYSFFDDFLECVRKQTKIKFDLLIINDNLDENELSEFRNKLQERGLEKCCNIIQGRNETGFLSDFRVQLLEEAKNRKYKLLVIGDIDDTFADNRVGKIYDTYLNNMDASFFYNILIDEKGTEIFKDMPNEVGGFSQISQCNFLGMSNTAINLCLLDIRFIESLYEDGCNVFDWYLYARILIANGKGMFVPDTYTTYRIYENNLAGIQREQIADIEKEREVKIEHYRRLEKYARKLYDYRIQLENMKVDEEFYKLKYYNKNKQGYWWNNIRLEENDV